MGTEGAKRASARGTVGAGAAPTARAPQQFDISVGDQLGTEVSDDEFARLWTMGIGSERTLGRPIDMERRG